MGTIKAVLVGVCEYPALKAPSLPFCKNDLYATKDALQSGLCVAQKNILLCGENGTVTINEMLNTIKTVLSTANPDDILIFYFSGHGGKNCLALSDGKVNLQLYCFNTSRNASYLSLLLPSVVGESVILHAKAFCNASSLNSKKEIWLRHIGFASLT